MPLWLCEIEANDRESCRASCYCRFASNLLTKLFFARSPSRMVNRSKCAKWFGWIGVVVVLIGVPQISRAGVFQDLVDAILKLTAAVVSLDEKVDKLTDEVDDLNSKADNILHFLEAQTPVAFDLISNFTDVLSHGANKMADAIHPLGHAAQVVTGDVGVTAVYVIGTAVCCYAVCKLVVPVTKKLVWVTAAGFNGVKKRWTTYRTRNSEGRMMNVIAVSTSVNGDTAGANTEDADSFPPDTVLIVDGDSTGDSAESSDEVTGDESAAQRKPLMAKKYRKKRHNSQSNARLGQRGYKTRVKVEDVDDRDDESSNSACVIL